MCRCCSPACSFSAWGIQPVWAEVKLGKRCVHGPLESLYWYRCTSSSCEVHLQWLLAGGSTSWTLNVKELRSRKQICLAFTLFLLFGDKDREKTVPLGTALIHFSDGTNDPITPLLINEGEKCFQRQPTSSVSPRPAAGCWSAGQQGWYSRLGTGLRITLSSLVVPGIYLCLLQTRALLRAVSDRSLCNTLSQVRQEVVRCWLRTSGLFWSPFVIPEDLVRGCLNPQLLFSSVGAGLHRSAVPAGAGHRCPCCCSVGIGVARSLSGATPRDAAGRDAAWLSPRGAQRKPSDTRGGGKDGSC